MTATITRQQRKAVKGPKSRSRTRTATP